MKTTKDKKSISPDDKYSYQNDGTGISKLKKQK